MTPSIASAINASGTLPWPLPSPRRPSMANSLVGLDVEDTLPVQMASITAQLAELRRDIKGASKRLQVQQADAQKEMDTVRKKAEALSKQGKHAASEKQARIDKLLHRLDSLEKGVGREQTECIRMLDMVLSAVDRHGAVVPTAPSPAPLPAQPSAACPGSVAASTQTSPARQPQTARSCVTEEDKEKQVNTETERFEKVAARVPRPKSATRARGGAQARRQLPKPSQVDRGADRSRFAGEVAEAVEAPLQIGDPELESDMQFLPCVDRVSTTAAEALPTRTPPLLRPPSQILEQPYVQQARGIAAPMVRREEDSLSVLFFEDESAILEPPQTGIAAPSAGLAEAPRRRSKSPNSDLSFASIFTLPKAEHVEPIAKPIPEMLAAAAADVDRVLKSASRPVDMPATQAYVTSKQTLEELEQEQVQESMAEQTHVEAEPEPQSRLSIAASENSHTSSVHSPKTGDGTQSPSTAMKRLFSPSSASSDASAQQVPKESSGAGMDEARLAEPSASSSGESSPSSSSGSSSAGSASSSNSRAPRQTMDRE